MNEPKNHEKEWTAIEVLKLNNLNSSDKSSNEIAQLMGRTQEAILSKNDEKE